MFIALLTLKEKTLKIILLITSLFLIGFNLGCGSLPSLTTLFQLKDYKDPKELSKHTYRKQLKFEVDGKTYEGVAVLPRKTSYQITIMPEEKMTYYIFQTPHREVVFDKPETGWFNKKFTYNYAPQYGLEDRGYMPLEIAALNKEQVADSFAFIEFQDARPEISLEANIRCNGNFDTANGVSLCQTAKGLIQEIFFQEKVLITPSENGCAEPETKDGYFWKIQTSEGECPYYFTAQKKHSNGKRMSHRFTVISYTKIGVK